MTHAELQDDGKAYFDHIYDQPDPRAYYRTLCGLGYEIPQRALPVVQTLLAERAKSAPQGSGPQRVLDVCCSYGINAALLNFDLTLDELHQRYADPAVDGVTPEELAQSDQDLFASRRRPVARVTGLDVAAKAVEYGRRTGLLDDGWAEDLETDDPSPALAAELADVDLVMTTGGVGYVTDQTFDRLLRPRTDGSAPWVAAWVLRIYSFDQIAEKLAAYGLVTEHLAGVTFPQRRFASDEERDAAMAGLDTHGRDPSGLEDEGRYHAELYVARPADEVARLPLTELLGGLATAG